jgi:hypothetical protein
MCGQTRSPHLSSRSALRKLSSIGSLPRIRSAGPAPDHHLGDKSLVAAVYTPIHVGGADECGFPTVLQSYNRAEEKIS